MRREFMSRTPWSTQPSLKEMAREIGVDFDRFITAIREGREDAEIAEELGVNADSVASLRSHFQRFGVHSVFGQD
ncbi:MAG: helix-turn-helix domain-containing protein [Clostridia bacterium]|nr:helix-turn-helix domain-containing protein [Clostridia bacterium]